MEAVSSGEAAGRADLSCGGLAGWLAGSQRPPATSARTSH